MPRNDFSFWRPRRLAPQPADAITIDHISEHSVTDEDFVLGDDDGVPFLLLGRATDIAEIARQIRDTERRQAAFMRTGTSLRAQTLFTEFFTAHDTDGITHRQHLRAISSEIKE